jgi:low temperature requirement protein LtrA
MTGALIFASGVTRLFAADDLRIIVIGYVIMRLASLSLWLRAAHDDPEHRPAALRHAFAIGVVQACWVILVFVLPHDWQLGGFVILAISELLIPVWSERPSPTTWHSHHIAERYGLFTIIVLGESVLSSVVAIQSTIEAHSFNADLIPLIVGGLLILYTVWWLYFYQPAHDLLESLDLGGTFIWAYGQLFIFAAVAAIGSGLAVAVDWATHHAEISAAVAGLAVAIPVAIYLISLWILQERPRAERWYEQAAFPLCALLALLAALTDQAVLLIGLLMAALLTIKLIASPTGNEAADEDLGIE